MRFHCSILRARGKSTPLRVPAEGWAARTESEEVFVPQAHLLEFQPKAGSRKRHQSGHMGLASPMNGRRAKRAPARRAGQAVHGPLVKRSRHRPLTPVTRVRFPHGSPFTHRLVYITLRSHLFPSRTQKLSSAVPKILGGRLPGKIGLCQL